MTRRLLACFLAAASLGAQLQKAPQPPGLTNKLPAAPGYAFPPLPVQKPSGGDKASGEAIGKHRAVPLSAIKKGKCTTLAGGRQIWRLQLRSPGAIGLRVHFLKFAAGQGRVWMYGGSANDFRVVGPYSRSGIDETGAFWSDTIFADSLTVEYEMSPGARARAEPPFQLSEIAHLFQ